MTRIRLERPLGFWEATCVAAHRRLRLATQLLAVARFDGPVEAEGLRTALLHLQHRHPLLRARIVENPGAIAGIAVVDRDELSSADVPLSIEPAGTDWHLAAEASFDDDVTAGAFPWRARLVESHDGSGHALIFGFHHALLDGRAMVSFVRELLSTWIALLEEPARAPPPSTPLPPAAESTLAGAPDQLAELARRAAARPPRAAGATWPVDRSAPLAGRRTGLRFATLGDGFPERLARACRQAGVTVNGALFAALARAAAPLRSPGDDDAKYSVLTDVRPYCGPPVEAATFASLAQIVEPVLSPMRGASLHALARHAHERFVEELARQVALGFSPRTYRPHHLSLLPGFDPTQVERRTEFPGGPALSNFGRTDVGEAWGPMRLRELHFTAGQAWGRFAGFLVASTAAGALQLTLSWPRPLLAEAHAQALFDGVVDALRAFADESG